MKYLVISLASLIILTGCFNRVTIENEIYTALEDIVQYESEFEAQQGVLIELEKQEKEIYDEILTVGMKEQERVKDLAQKAIDIVNERQDHLDKERESMVTAENEFKKIESLINEIKDEALKKEAEELYKIMLKRYKTHEELYNQYSSGNQYDIELYEMLQEDEVSLEVIEPQIDKINESYQKVFDLNEQFNALTNEYNEMKLNFYSQAGINVKISESEK